LFPQSSLVERAPAGVRGRRVAAAALFFAVVVVYFFIEAWQGLYVRLSPDDLMNLYTAFHDVSWLRLITANLTPFSTLYRPLGSLYYRSVYSAFGLNPLAFRAVTYAFLVINLGLLFLLVRQLSGRRQIAALAVLIWAYHSRLFDIYDNNGTVYDVVCFTFYCATLLYYARVRPAGSFTWRSAAIVLALFTAAMNAKEMAATLPAMMLAYEIIYCRPGRGEVRPWLTRALVVVWIAFVSVAVAMVVREAYINGYRGNPLYHVRIAFPQFFSTNGSFLDEMILWYKEPRVFTPAVILLFWGALIVIAVLSRRQYVRFLVFFVIVTPLPVVFIPTRTFFAMYLTYAGYATLVAALIIETRDYLWKRVWKRTKIPDGLFEPEQLATVAFLLICVVHFNSLDPYKDVIGGDRNRMRQKIAGIIDAFGAAATCPPPGGTMLFLHDPYKRDEWFLEFTAGLVCGDVALQPARAQLYTRPVTRADWQAFDLVMDYREGRFEFVSGRRSR
jgi:hypothetical protein